MQFSIKIYFILFTSFFYLFACVNAQGIGWNIRITYVANEGVMIESSDGVKVLIDALHKKYYPDYLFPSASLMNDMIFGEGDFNGVDLVLVSHVHADHFDAVSVGNLLLNQSQSILISSQQVNNSVSDNFSDYSSIEERIITPTFNENGKSYHQLPGINLSVFELSHGIKNIQNLGHILEIKGKKILHVGDAAFTKSEFSKVKITKENIDIAILPYWYLIEKNVKEKLTKWINPKHIIASHVPPAEGDELKKNILKLFPDAVVFTESKEVLIFK